MFLARGQGKPDMDEEMAPARNGGRRKAMLIARDKTLAGKRLHAAAHSKNGTQAKRKNGG